MKSPKILYLAHDLADAAVHKRAAMLRDGGAIVTVAGFRRTSQPMRDVAGFIPVDLGRTHNGKFMQRILAVLRCVAFPLRVRNFADAEIILARNLEMLVIGLRHASRFPSAVVVYESLDLHRLLLNKGPVGRALRWLEARLSRKVALVITSSPGFIDAHFSRYATPVLLVENKVYDPEGKIPIGNTWKPRPAGPPWKIGWFGILRCKKSLHLLADLAAQSNGTVEIVIRGRPALDQIPEFFEIVSNTPGMQFRGAYKYPEELPDIYRSVHFTWAVDFYEEGGNSSLLLPNRLYEGGLFHAVPIALRRIVTGCYLNRLNIGVTLESPLEKSLSAFFSSLTAEHYRALEEGAARTPLTQWHHSQKDCRSLVGYLTSLQPPVPQNAQ